MGQGWYPEHFGPILCGVVPAADHVPTAVKRDFGREDVQCIQVGLVAQPPAFVHVPERSVRNVSPPDHRLALLLRAPEGVLPEVGLAGHARTFQPTGTNMQPALPCRIAETKPNHPSITHNL